MKKEVIKCNGMVCIRVPKQVIKILLLDKNYSSHLYWSSGSNIPFLKLDCFIDYSKLDMEEISSFVDGLENEALYYCHETVKWWVDTGIESFNEYCEIARDYPISQCRYTTLVKRYCKWAK